MTALFCVCHFKRPLMQQKWEKSRKIRLARFICVFFARARCFRILFDARLWSLPQTLFNSLWIFDCIEIFHKVTSPNVLLRRLQEEKSSRQVFSVQNRSQEMCLISGEYRTAERTHKCYKRLTFLAKKRFKKTAIPSYNPKFIYHIHNTQTNQKRMSLLRIHTVDIGVGFSLSLMRHLKTDYNTIMNYSSLGYNLFSCVRTHLRAFQSAIKRFHNDRKAPKFAWRIQTFLNKSSSTIGQNDFFPF